VRILHPIDPVYDKNSEILILGSFPSVKSREDGFFYGHKQNRFWRVMADIFHTALPETTTDKKQLLLEHHIALWDVIASCEITGSSDSTIRDVRVNDLSAIFREAQIGKIIANGRKAYSLYQKYLYPEVGKEAILLPSTSPANAQYSLNKLINEWKKVLENPHE